MALTARELNRSTLARQMLLQRESVGVVEAVERIVALQAQEPVSPYLALWSRIAGFAPGELDAAFRNGTIVKSTLMRITLHAVAADDHAPLHEAMLPNLRASRLNDRRFRSLGPTVDDVDAITPELLAFLAEVRPRDEIEAFLAERFGDLPEPGLWWALRTYLPIHHATDPDAAWGFGRRPVYRAAPSPASRLGDDALGHLVTRYLAGFGPATIADIAQFSLQRRSDVRTAIGRLGDGIVSFGGPGGATYFDVPEASVPDADTQAPARLLPMWDSILLAYADRTRVVRDDYRREVIRRNGDTLATVLVDGEVRGVWRAPGGVVEVRAFESLDRTAWDEIAAECEGLMAFLADRDPAPYSRYDRWWAQLPPGETRSFGR